MFSSLVEELIVTDDPALIERLRTNELDARRLAAEQAAITREVERRGLFHDDGHRSVKAFLRANLNWSNSQAASTIKVAALLDTVAGAGNALLNGHIGTAQANELGRLRANPRVGDQLTATTDAATTLLDAAEQLKYEDFRIVGLRWETLADTNGAEQRAANNIEHRDATVIDAGGELFMRATGGTALNTAEMVAIFDAFVDHEFQLDCATRDATYGPNAPTSLLERTDKQRRRDALQNIFRAAQAATDAGLTVGPIPTIVNIIASRYDTELALATAGLTPTPTGLTAPPLTQRRKETASGSPISNDELVRSLIHGRVRSVITDNTGMPISYGRTRRLFTGPIRAMAKLLGHRCSHPGCDIPAERCQVDHLDEFANGTGHTSLTNAGLECSSHNRHKHRTKLQRTRITTDHIETTRADGSTMRPTGQRTRTDIIRARLRNQPALSAEAKSAIDAAMIKRSTWNVVRLRVVEGELRLAA
ncbi:DUF222 domain-containing protein [Ilumatobacter sp.]|uniref:HNH endonuclease signature motif containing protein n=1 Tax=Ilumatobacter sp. TaxID=1967498 RepID=UPI00375299B2